jgi:hypothetical protein
MPGGVVSIPWYAAVFRGDKLEAGLAEIAPVATRYGATHYEVLRSLEDRYRFRQTATFDDKLDFERYWYGPEFVAFRTEFSSLFQIPIVYEWHERVSVGAVDPSSALADARG